MGHLENPRASIPGTKVIFADIQEGERGALIAYFKKLLRSNSWPLPYLSQKQSPMALCVHHI